MVWINGSVLHDPPEKLYECRICQLFVVKHADGDYDVRPLKELDQKT